MCWSEVTIFNPRVCCLDSLKGRCITMKRKKCLRVVLFTVLFLLLFSQSVFAASGKVKSITLSKKKITMTVGQSKTLKAKVKPSSANKKVIWSSSNKKVVSVSSSGKITAKKTGKAKITCKSKKYPKIKAICIVTVTKSVVKTTGITLKDSQGTIPEDDTAYFYVGSKYQLTAVVSPSTATYKEVKWASSDSSVVAISNYELCTAVSPGTVKITCSSVKYPKISASMNIVSMKNNKNTEEKTDPAYYQKDVELLEQVETILSRTGYPLYMKLQGNDPTRKNDSKTYKPIWSVSKNKNGTINYILAYEKDGWNDISTTYCLNNWPTVTTKYLAGSSSIRDSLRDGSYSFKTDPKYVIIGWDMWGYGSTKVDLELRLNEKISDDIYQKLIEYSKSPIATRSGGSVSIVYGKNTKGELIGKYAGIISYNYDSTGTFYDFIGTDSLNSQIYGKSFTGTAYF